MRHKVRNIHKRSPRKTLYILLGVAFLIIASMAAAFPFVMSRTAETAMIRIPGDTSAQILRDTLTRYYGNSFASRVMTLVKASRADLHKRHGAYEIPAGTNPIGVARKLTRGAQTPVKITINGFRDIDLLCRRISSKLDFPADSLHKALSDPETLRPYALTEAQAPALFIDDTYEVYWTTTPRELIDKLGHNYLSLWNADRRGKAERLGLSPAEIMTVASIADEETNYAPEKGDIGRLYINRLKKGMRLQADPTVRFALNDFTIRRVNMKHLKADSPYNTYLHTGLPPGPIRTTGRATVDAILDSRDHNYLYMCAKEDFSGSHNFATTYDEHMRNARLYRAALDRRGIK